MKFDMSGAGSVLGAIRALAGMKAPVNVVGVIPTCENMPGGARHAARRHRHHAVGPDGRDPQHRRRGPPDPVRRAHLRGALQARGGDRHRHPHRRLRDRARPRRQRACSPTTRSSPTSCAPRPTTPGTASGRCRCGRTTRSSCARNFADFANIGGRPGGAHHRGLLPRALHAQAALGAPRHRRHRLEERPREGLDRPAGAAAGAVRAAPRRPQMTSIDFYFNAEDRLQVACRLAGKAASAEASAC